MQIQKSEQFTNRKQKIIIIDRLNKLDMKQARSSIHPFEKQY